MNSKFFFFFFLCSAKSKKIKDTVIIDILVDVEISKALCEDIEDNIESQKNFFQNLYLILEKYELSIDDFLKTLENLSKDLKKFSNIYQEVESRLKTKLNE
jgi:hypothetical protein